MSFDQLADTSLAEVILLLHAKRRAGVAVANAIARGIGVAIGTGVDGDRARSELRRDLE